MARDTEELLIALRADLNQFEKGFAKAHGISVGQMRKIQRQIETDATKIERRMGALGSNIRAGFLGALTVGGAMALGNQIGEAVERIANLKETAQSAGVSVSELQQLLSAGMAAGLEESDLVSMLQRLNKELAKAKAEGKNVGTTTEEFLKLADTVAGAKTAIEATGIVTEKLGKTGAKAIPLLAQGSGEIAKQMQAAKVAGDTLATAADEFYDKWKVKIGEWRKQFDIAITGIVVSIDTLLTRMDDRSRAQLKFRRDEILDRLKTDEGAGILDFMGGGGVTDDLKAELDTINWRLYSMSRIPKPPLLQTGSGEGDTETESAADTAKKIQDRIGDMTTEIEKIPEALPALTEMQEAMGEVKDAFKDAFSDLAVAAGDGKLKLEEVIDVVDSLRDRMIRMAAEKLFELIFNTLVNSQQPGSLPIPGRAGGGPVNAGQPYMVGEKGRELFVPSQSGRVIPSGRLGGGSAPVINISNPVGVAASARASQIDGKWVVDVVTTLIDSSFGANLQKHAPLIGGRPVSKRTS
jgi:hypothetical protein